MRTQGRVVVTVFSVQKRVRISLFVTAYIGLSLYIVHELLRSVSFAATHSPLPALLSIYMIHKMKRTTGYHPECNGLIERWHRNLLAAFKARAEADGTQWTRSLTSVVISLNAAVRENCGLSAHELVFGAPMRLLERPSRPPHATWWPQTSYRSSRT